MRTLADLAGVLRGLRRRQARRNGGAEPTYRELAAATGWSHGIIGEYLAGRVLPPTDRFDVLVRLLGATPAEQGALATARDRVEEQRRQALVPRGTRAGAGAGTAGEAGDLAAAETGPIAAAAAGSAPNPAAAVTVPRQLPGKVFGFTGRAEALAELDALLAPRAEGGSPHHAEVGLHAGQPADRPSTAAIAAVVGEPTDQPSATAAATATASTAAAGRTGSGLPAAAIAVIAGTAGVGKTALAIHWSHRVAHRFPDGQLHVDLRGYDPDQPLAPADALARFLRALGVDGASIPAAEDERAAVYRTLLADRRMLVLLDNASGADQVRPLIPGTGSCFLLVTSRDALAGLVARDGARRIVLNRLGPPESATLLRTLVGTRAESEPDAVAELARHCTHLPLALRIAAELASARPHATLADLAAELGDEPRRLDSLDAAGDPRTAVRAVFSWSLRHLMPGTANAFALLGLQPGPDIEPHAVAALADCRLTEARAMMSELVRAHLLEPAGTERGTLHDLLRAYAAELAGEDRAAVTRLLDHYLHAAGMVMDTLFPHESRGRPPLRVSSTPAPALGTREAAGRWLDRERPNLVAAALHAARHGWHDHAVAFSGILWRAFEVSGHYQEALAVHAAAAEVRSPRPAYGRADVLANLGSTHWWTGDHRRARECFEQSLAEHPAPHGRARALARLAVVHERLGDYPAAARCLAEALELHRSLGDRHGEGAQLINLGALHRRLGRHAEAASGQREAATLFAELGDGRLEGYALGNLAVVEALLGRPAEALDHLTRALELCRAAGDRGGEGSAIGTLGFVHRLVGDHARALDHLHRALTLHQETGERSLETETLNGLGETLLAMGRPDAALERHEAALILARETADRFEEARALDGIGCAHAAAGHGSEARRHWLGALAIFGPLGVPEAGRVRARLATEPS